MAAPGDLTGIMTAGPVAPADWLVVAPVAVAITVGALLLMVRHRVRLHPPLAIAGLVAMAAVDVLLLLRVLDEGPLVMTMGGWLPPFGISFVADALGAGFALTATLVALACTAFSVRDVDAAGRRYGFYPFVMLMMAGVSGAFLTGDIFNLYVWFEVFVISSFGLLTLGSRREQLDGGFKYAVLNLVATTLFLIATAYLYGALGTLNMADIMVKAGTTAGAPVATIAVLYLTAFGMKAAAFPLHFWLPASYHTPRMVTAALFGGLLTKIGVYALLRTLVMLFPQARDMLSSPIAWVAAATMLVGALGALAQNDLRRMAGFLVVSGVGVMLAGLALGDALALAGTVLYAIHSMLAMAALYLFVGAIGETRGTFALDALAGIQRRSPALAGIAVLLMLAVSGLPPASGVWPKAILVRAAIEAGNGWLAAAVLASGFLTTLVLGRVVLLAFWRERAEGDAAAGPVAVSGASYAVLAAFSLPILLLGLWPEPAIDLAGRAAAGLVDARAYYLAVFPGGRP